MRNPQSKLVGRSYQRLLAPLLLVFSVVSFAGSDALKIGGVMQQPLFYRGDLDEQVMTADNGAHVNRDYLSFITEGPWGEVRTIEVTPRIHTITGYGISNYTFIEGDTGLILVDTGNSIGAGLEILKKKRAFSGKPIVAIVYTHHHYTGGSRAIVERDPDREIPIYGHPDVDRNLMQTLSQLATGAVRRGAIQFGSFLPREGVPEAEFGINDPHFDEPALNAMGHMPVTHPVSDGQEIHIDGLQFIFHHAIADTPDSLIIHIPELDAVVHNVAVMPFMFPMYTLRGDFYRPIPEIVASVDKVRSIRPQHLIGCHGFPVSDRDDGYALATAHRDALAFVFQQTVKGINEGLDVEEIVARTSLPEYLRQVPQLFTAYVDVEHMVRGVFRGLIGWWSNDTAELHPPSDAEMGAEIVSGFGGIDAVLQRVEMAMGEKRYNLAAKLAAYAVASDPDNMNARKAKASALRKMAYSTPTGFQTRNFMLTEALELEGALDLDRSVNLAPKMLSAQAVAGLPPNTFLQSLAYNLDPSQVADVAMSVRIELTDVGHVATLALRYGVVEYTETVPKSPDLELALGRDDWAHIVVGQKRLLQLVEESKAVFRGDKALRERFLAAYSGVL